MEWDGMERSGMDWYGIGRDGMDWKGVEWNKFGMA